MTPQTLMSAGQALYGPHWLQPLANALEVNKRTIRRWANGEYEIPEGVGNDLIGLCRARGANLAKIADAIEDSVNIQLAT